MLENTFGFRFIDSVLSKEEQNKIRIVAEYIEQKAKQDFDCWLEQNGYMINGNGVLVKRQ